MTTLTHTTQRKRQTWARRRIGWLSLTTGRGISDNGTAFRTRPGPDLADIFRALPADLRALYLLGDTPGDFRSWALISPPGEIVVENGGHFLPDIANSILRFRLPDGSKLAIHRADAWGLPSLTNPEQARDAWEQTAAALDRIDRGAFVASTPATTGRLLLQRVIPDGLAVLSKDQQDHIRATTGQGRIEHFAPPFPYPKPARVYGFDMRVAYLACCNSLGAGPVERDTCDDFDPYRPGRYRVTAWVPRQWAHVGILPLRTADGWEWPAQPSRMFQTWVTGAELLQAHQFGWDFKILERELLQPARPLDRWARGLSRELLRVGSGTPTGRMLRSIALHTIGALWGKHSRQTRELPLAQFVALGKPDRLLGTVSIDNGVARWTESVPPLWPDLVHPEWVAAIWARCRTRLLSSHDRGALHLAHSDLIALRTDAIYTRARPEWPDDGRVGSFRLVYGSAGRVPWPETPGELLGGRNG